MDNNETRYWDPLVMQQELSPAERVLRDRFVEQYLIDYDAWAAAVRCGFLRSVAMEYAQHFMTEPYVRQQIEARKHAAPEDPRKLRTERQCKVEELLWELAYYKGPGASHAARVSATTKLCNIYDMDGAAKLKAEVTHRGGVMMVPAIASIEAWEAEASKAQDELIAASQEDRQTRAH